MGPTYHSNASIEYHRWLHYLFPVEEISQRFGLHSMYYKTTTKINNNNNNNNKNMTILPLHSPQYRISPGPHP